MSVFNYYFDKIFLEIFYTDEIIDEINLYYDISLYLNNKIMIKNNFEKFLANEFNMYFNGKKNRFDLSIINLSKLNDFQRNVFMILIQNVSFGKTITYKELACLYKDKNYSRAVANALSRNLFPIIIPCHRVINSDGSLGGFSCISGGISAKKYLLQLEKLYV